MAQALSTHDTTYANCGPIDITNTFERKYSRGPIDNIPLHKLVDPRFWWNEHLSQPLIDNGVSWQ